MARHQMNSSTFTSDKAAIIFLKRLFLGFTILSLTTFLWKRSDIFPWIGSCNPAGYSDESFLSYCHSARFGDLEHKVYWQNLEPGIIDNVRNADVLFLGNSRTQYAFSTSVVTDFFARKDYSHYVFGFGMGSQNSVPEILSEKYNIRPKAVIINADPFFTNRISGTNKAMLEHTWSRQWELKVKRFLSNQQKNICSNNDSGFSYSLMCRGVEETLYRRIEDGHWDVRYFRKNKRIPTNIDNQQDLGVTIEEAKVIAEHFIETLGLSKHCVVITVTPRTQTPLDFAKKLAKGLEVTGIFPKLTNLVTVDDSHLDPTSALRWSQALLDEAETVLERCTR